MYPPVARYTERLGAHSQLGAGKSAALFGLFAALLIASHAPLLRLPYFWDEAGYYIPAARDLYLSGALIPYSTITNAHPPLLMSYLALAWKIFGYSPLATRSAILLIAAFALAGIFELARRVATPGVRRQTVWAGRTDPCLG